MIADYYSTLDILNPQLNWIEGRCYRTLPVLEPQIENEENHAQISEHGFDTIEDEPATCPPGVDDGRGGLVPVVVPEQLASQGSPSAQPFPDAAQDTEDNAFPDAPLPSKTQRGDFRCTLPIASAFFGHIIGKGGETKRRIEYETQCKIMVPPKGQKGEIELVSESYKQALTCRNRLLLMVNSARERQGYTHFISIPLSSKSLKHKLHNFKDSVMWQHKNASGIDESIFQTYDRIHVTVGMLCLLNDGDRQLAKMSLEKCINDSVRPLLPKSSRLKVQVQGLEYMNDDPGQVDVLYAKVLRPGGRQPATIFQKISDVIVRDISQTGLMPRRQFVDTPTVKLHVTLMNSRFRKTRTQNFDEESDLGVDLPSKKPRDPFDASGILKDLGEYDFGEVELKEIHLSQLHSSSMKEQGGYYAATMIVKL